MSHKKAGKPASRRGWFIVKKRVAYRQEEGELSSRRGKKRANEGGVLQYVTYPQIEETHWTPVNEKKVIPLQQKNQNVV